MFQKFHSPLEDMLKSSKRFEKDYMTKSDLKLMFHKLPEILESHVKARDELRQVMKKWNPKKTDVGKIIGNASKVWTDLYPSYIDMHYDALSALDRCESRPRFKSFIEVSLLRSLVGFNWFSTIRVFRQPSRILPVETCAFEIC